MPKSARLIVVLASAPHRSFLIIGGAGGTHLKLLMASVTGLVTPCRVSSPTTDVGASPLNPANLPLKVAFGNFSTSNISGLLACVFILSCPKSMEAVSILMSTEPDLPALS